MILDDIVFNKRQEVTALKARLSQKKIGKLLSRAPKQRNFIKIFNSGQIALIAEIKKASPSAGVIIKRFNPLALGQVYANSGASAISVLTDTKFFKTSLEDLSKIRKALRLPVLRKDFIIDEAQVYEARLAGADAVLLIVRLLTDEQLKGLLALTEKLGMQALVEIHDAQEAERVLKTQAKVVGINNRDLDTLTVDMGNTFSLLQEFPALKKRIVVSESGIKSAEDVVRLRAAGVQGILVGEAILKSRDIKDKVKELTGN